HLIPGGTGEERFLRMDNVPDALALLQQVPQQVKIPVVRLQLVIVQKGDGCAAQCVETGCQHPAPRKKLRLRGEDDEGAMFLSHRCFLLLSGCASGCTVVCPYNVSIFCVTARVPQPGMKTE